jgi:predicted AAA+ superfamily ATPase
MIRGLEKYSPSAIRQRASSPKLQVYNMGLMSASDSRDKMTISSHPESYGRWVESAIGAHLANQALTEQINLFYWREGNHEVDFVLEKGDKTIGIEVKSGRNKSSSGIPVFSQRFNPARILLVGKEGISVEDFLQMALSELFT